MMDNRVIDLAIASILVPRRMSTQKTTIAEVSPILKSRRGNSHPINACFLIKLVIIDEGNEISFLPSRRRTEKRRK